MHKYGHGTEPLKQLIDSTLHNPFVLLWCRFVSGGLRPCAVDDWPWSCPTFSFLHSSSCNSYPRRRASIAFNGPLRQVRSVPTIRLYRNFSSLDCKELADSRGAHRMRRSGYHREWEWHPFRWSGSILHDSIRPWRSTANDIYWVWRKSRVDGRSTCW